jgi:hypothetical protein
MIYVYVGLAIILLYFIYYNFKINNKVEKYGEPEYFLKHILLPLKVTYPKYRKLAENKGRIKYVFYDDLFELNFEFIYLPNKIQVSVLMNSNLSSKRVTATCKYDIDEIQECCNKLASKMILG